MSKTLRSKQVNREATIAGRNVCPHTFQSKEQRFNSRKHHTHHPLNWITGTREREDDLKFMQPPFDTLTSTLQNQVKVASLFDKQEAGFLITLSAMLPYC